MLSKDVKLNNSGMLGAYYYPWYGKPTLPVFGMGDWKQGYTDHPVLGEYNCQNEEIINQHISWAREAGIDFFAVEWSGLHTWEDITLQNYYLLAKKVSEIKFCIHYDSSLTLNKLGIPYSYNFDDKYSVTKTKGEKFLEDFEYLADTYFNHPQYLKINNYPLVIIYNVSAFRNVSKYLEQLNKNMKRKGFSLFLVGDVVCWAGLRLSKNNLSFFWKQPLEEIVKVFYRAIRRLSLNNLEEDVLLSKYFSAITGYNMYAVNRTTNFLKNVDKVYQKFWNYTHPNNLCFIPTVIPGYNDRNLKGLNRPILGRKEGKFYKEFWKMAKKYLDSSLKIALINSFNEWHEGTGIEPSKEYGNQYLELTKLLKNEVTSNQS